MRPGWLLAAALLLAGPALAPLMAPAGALAPADDSHVVIAVVDTGINPYHAEFLAPELTAHPSQYLRGYPADARPLSLCLDALAQPDCRDLAGALRRDAPAWQALEQTRPQAGGWGPLYFLPGTRIVAAVSVGAPDDDFVRPTRIFDDVGHGTATASLAAGASLGLCPRCLLVVVEGPGEEALRWARDQPWIDIVTNSWGWVLNLGWPPPPFGTSNGLVTRAMVEQGKTVLFSAGNGPGFDTAPGITDVPDYLLPGESTYTSEYTGPDWIVTVGAVDPENGQPVAGTGRPVDIAAAGIDLWAARSDARSGEAPFAGTSASVPIAAGVFGHVLLALRGALGDRDEGPRAARGQGEVLAQGLPPPGALAGPLADGLLTRAELQRLVFATARPCPALPLPSCPSPADWPFPARAWGWTVPVPPVAYPLLVGYGSVDASSRDAAVRVGLGQEPLPPRPEADLWAKSDSLIRQRLWGFWAHGAKASDVLGP